MHFDWQQIIVLGIVSLAGLSVGRRLWNQVAGFRSKPGRSSGGCEGCPSSGNSSVWSKPVSAPLIQIRAKPPVHLRRPPADGN